MDHSLPEVEQRRLAIDKVMQTDEYVWSTRLKAEDQPRIPDAAHDHSDSEWDHALKTWRDDVNALAEKAVGWRGTRYRCFLAIMSTTEYQQSMLFDQALRPVPPCPEDLTISKRQWESKIQAWRKALKILTKQPRIPVSARVSASASSHSS